jgi:molybdopterin-guanine dinucleotide biosynthesis protein
LSVCGLFGLGQDHLLEQLIPALRRRGLRVSVVKHAHHRFDIDHPGKDSWRHRQAGAFEVVVASEHRLALMREYEQPCRLSVHQLLAELYEGVDWVLVEGFKRQRPAQDRGLARADRRLRRPPGALPRRRLHRGHRHRPMRPACPCPPGAPCWT